MKVAIQGERGSNSHVATETAFAGQAVEVVACAHSADVFERLASRSVERAVLPIENTLHGSVFEHYDLLLHYHVEAVAEVLLPVRHNLIVAPGVRLEEVRQVLSHPVALSQCRRWIQEHPAMEAMPAYDTAGSVKLLMNKGLRDTAGIAPVLAAEEYGADVLEYAIEDHAANYTRFYVLRAGQQTAPTWATNSDKVSLAFGLEHRPGTLMRALGVFEQAGLNLTKIESRPVPGRPWEYVFFADVRFSSDVQVDAALKELGRTASMLRVLGRYKAGE